MTRGRSAQTETPNSARQWPGIAASAPRLDVDWASMGDWPREGTAERLAGMVRRAITSGAFPPNYQISDAAVARSLGISRGPVREAFHQLIGEGLLRAEPNRGIFVMGLDLDALKDLYVARGCIEETAAIMLAKRHNDTEMSALRAALREIEAAVASGDWPAIVNADLSFHEALVGSAGSEHLSQLFSTLGAEARTYLHWLESVYRDLTTVPDEHHQIVDAIVKGDERAIRAVISSHMAEASLRLSSSPLVAGSAAPHAHAPQVSQRPARRGTWTTVVAEPAKRAPGRRRR